MTFLPANYSELPTFSPSALRPPVQFPSPLSPTIVFPARKTVVLSDTASLFSLRTVDHGFLVSFDQHRLCRLSADKATHSNQKAPNLLPYHASRRFIAIAQIANDCDGRLHWFSRSGRNRHSHSPSSRLPLHFSDDCVTAFNNSTSAALARYSGLSRDLSPFVETIPSISPQSSTNRPSQTSELSSVSCGGASGVIQPAHSTSGRLLTTHQHRQNSLRKVSLCLAK